MPALMYSNVFWIVSGIMALVGTAGIGGMLKTWLDHSRGKRKQTDDVALALVNRLESRVEKLEGDLEKERARCDAELGVHRHVNKNQRTMIYALLHLFDMPAARRKVALVSIRTELAAMEMAEAQEKAIIAAAPLGGAQ
ncbi:hypothetical protein [Sphingomonas soli]|uniref:hypothetical protein n=1 Tax=Sphingomonas soli TaxID=266127 RepID=UPI000831D0D0|nr:hypothetical protein [Sphingomonas soli]